MSSISRKTIKEIKEDLRSHKVHVPSGMNRAELVVYAENALGNHHHHKKLYTPKRSPVKRSIFHQALKVIDEYLLHGPVRHPNAPKHVSPRNVGHHTYSMKKMRLMTKGDIERFIESSGYSAYGSGMTKEQLVRYAYDLRI